MPILPIAKLIELILRHGIKSGAPFSDYRRSSSERRATIGLSMRDLRMGAIEKPVLLRGGAS
jgi:hypothetical protein